ncbi:MAG: hypothetical protein JWM80_4374 [Cyanobacteria bacterium RYN_339]|nr:hypothetical protein [Cyanobacteria bacterium RYN_339]
MDPHVREILDLFVRWFHFVAGIMWIGNSMLFNWLDRNLLKREGLKPGSMGEIWLLHGGGFYQVEKKMLEQGEAYPDPLHWFMWQNFTTWASGILLLVIVYYLGGESFMVDPAVAKLGGGEAIALGVGSLLVGCTVYEGIWRSPLGKNTQAGAAVSLVCLVAYTYFMCHMLSGRAAFIHVGAMLGTCMTMNVWMHIVPSQRKLTEGIKKGEAQDEKLSYRAKSRSIHNNYLTFPVLFTMISNHFPTTFGSPLNWLILLVVGLAAAGVRHFMNIRFFYGGWKPALAACAAAGVGGLVALTWPTAPKVTSAAPVAYSAVAPIVQARCATCHSAKPSDAQFTTAPSGLMLDTPAQIKAAADRIKQRAVDSTSMPLGNKTNMTPEERATLGQWIAGGAPL